jgi:hypothetical protein
MVWKKLEHWYGNRHLMVIAALSHLLKTEVPPKANHLKVKAVASAVERTHATLKIVGSEEDHRLSAPVW